MRTRLVTWLDALPIEDPVERRQASTLQVLLLIILGGCLVGLPLGVLTGSGATLIMPLIVYPVLAALTGASVWLLRAGRLTASVYLVVGAMLAGMLAPLVAVGLKGSEIVLPAFAVPVVLAGLMNGRRGLVFAGGLAVAGVGLVAALLRLGSPLVGFLPPTASGPATVALTFAMLTGVLCLVLDRFGDSLRDALAAAQSRERELEHLRGSLEVQVAERTSALAAALADVERREARLAAALAELQSAQATVRELSAPVIPVMEGVLVAPLVGALDVRRAELFAEGLLGSVERERARHVVLDVTGLPIVDTQVAQTLLRMAAALRLLGAQALLAGIRPEVAQTLVSLGADMRAIPAFASLREAVASLAPRRLASR